MSPFCNKKRNSTTKSHPESLRAHPPPLSLGLPSWLHSSMFSLNLKLVGKIVGPSIVGEIKQSWIQKTKNTNEYERMRGLKKTFYNKCILTQEFIIIIITFERKKRGPMWQPHSCHLATGKLESQLEFPLRFGGKKGPFKECSLVIKRDTKLPKECSHLGLHLAATSYLSQLYLLQITTRDEYMSSSKLVLFPRLLTKSKWYFSRCGARKSCLGSNRNLSIWTYNTKLYIFYTWQLKYNVPNMLLIIYNNRSEIITLVMVRAIYYCTKTILLIAKEIIMIIHTKVRIPNLWPFISIKTLFQNINSFICPSSPISCECPQKVSRYRIWTFWLLLADPLVKAPQNS